MNIISKYTYHYVDYFVFLHYLYGNRSEESEGEGPSRPVKADSAEREPHVGRVVLVEAAGGAERRRPHQPAFPALVVAPTAQIKVKEDYLVRSFKDGR